MSTNKNNVELGQQLARRIFQIGDGPKPCRRIAFMAGPLEAETSQGGLCEEALAREITLELNKLSAEQPQPRERNET